MSEAIMKMCRDTMNKNIEALVTQFARVNTGRAHASLIEDVPIEYFGSVIPLKQTASISVPESRQLLVTPWDRGAVSAIEKGIMASNLGLHPQVEGQTVRVMIPTMTEERRKDLRKVVDGYAEKIRIAIRTHRQDAIRDIKKEESAKALSEDESKRFQDQVQKLTEEHNHTIEQLLKAKVDEILTV